MIAISQRVEVIPGRGERRDALDQRWHGLLASAGLVGVPVPNAEGCAARLLAQLPVQGVLLTGGNDLHCYGGDAPERDAAEMQLLEFARRRQLPVLGVCRGMQLLQHSFGVALEPVEGHVATEQFVTINGERTQVNSFHRWGARQSVPELEIWARADDEVVKAVRHRDESLLGIMWHPERIVPFRADDIALLRGHFPGGSG